MNAKVLCVAMAALVAASCSDGIVGPAGPRISFTVEAPAQVEAKAVVDVEVRITDTFGVTRPLVVSFEKANAGEAFFGVASFILRDDERVAVARIPVLLDPRVRVTVRESSPAEFTVSKTIAIDVVAFP
jgi:hypothetical protein